MTSNAAKAAHRINGGDLRIVQSGRAGTSENIESLADLQAQHLAVIFGLSPDAAVTIAELAFAAGCPR